MREFLIHDMKFCQMENVETHFWKILYHSIIDLLRKCYAEDSNPDIKLKLIEIIDDGTNFFEELLQSLEVTYKFSVDDFVGENASTSIGSAIKRTKYTQLALVSAQKILLFLGDLARYKEQINETNSYGKVKQWYTRAQQIFPNNGRPYNSLAVLCVISVSSAYNSNLINFQIILTKFFHITLQKRKIDAVYYFMRSIMSSNPVHSAKESLIGIFDENRKKVSNYCVFLKFIND